MGIIHTAKKNIISELVRRKKMLKEEEIMREEKVLRKLTKKEELDVSTFIIICMSLNNYLLITDKK